MSLEGCRLVHLHVGYPTWDLTKPNKPWQISTAHVEPKKNKEEKIYLIFLIDCQHILVLTALAVLACTLNYLCSWRCSFPLFLCLLQKNPNIVPSLLTFALNDAVTYDRARLKFFLSLNLHTVLDFSAFNFCRLLKLEGHMDPSMMILEQVSRYYIICFESLTFYTF